MNGPSPLAPFGLLFGVAATVILAVRVCRRYRANLRAAGRTDGAGAPQASWATWALLIVLMAGFVHYQPGTLRYRVRDVSSPGNMSMPPALVPGLLAAILLLSLGAYVRASFHPDGRVARLIARGRFDEAEALIRDRLARRRGRSSPSAPAENPYTAPVAPSWPADPLAEAEDWNNLGLIGLDRREWAEAMTCFERAEAIGAPNGYLRRSKRGLALIAHGRLDEGGALVERAIAETPHDQPWARALLGLLLTERLIDAGRHAQAGPILDRAERDRRRAQGPSRSAARQFAARVAAARARLAGPRGVGDASPMAALNSAPAER